MQASLLDGPGLPGAAVRAGGGDESTVSRLGRFKAGGVMVVLAKTTGASRTYHWKITFSLREIRAPRPPPLPPPPPSPLPLPLPSPFSPRLLSFSDATFFLSPLGCLFAPLLSLLLSSVSSSLLLLPLLLLLLILLSFFSWRSPAIPTWFTSSSASCRGFLPAPPPVTLRRRRCCTCHTLLLQGNRGNKRERERETHTEEGREGKRVGER